MSDSSIPQSPSRPAFAGIPLDRARALAEAVADLLRPGCAEIVIAGSIRREKETVKDIELVARLQPELDRRLAQSRLDAAILKAVAAGALAFDKAVKRAGSRYKRLLYPIMAGSTAIAVDLFIADEQNFGNTLAIRTGDADFTRLMVTQRAWNGLLPVYCKQEDGYLWNWKPRQCKNDCAQRGEIIPCPTEQAFFDALGIPFVPPPERTGQKARELTFPFVRRPHQEDT